MFSFIIPLLICACEIPDPSLFQKGSGNLYEGGTSASEVPSEDSGTTGDSGIMEDTAWDSGIIEDSAIEDTGSEDPNEESDSEDTASEETTTDSGNPD